jgi:hypothetical protein
MLAKLAGRQGFEPRYRGPEPRVLPLDDLPVPAAARGEARTVDYSQSFPGGPKADPLLAPRLILGSRGTIASHRLAVDHLIVG